MTWFQIKFDSEMREMKRDLFLTFLNQSNVLSSTDPDRIVVESCSDLGELFKPSASFLK